MRLIYFIALKLASLFVFWVPEFQERKSFERKNQNEPGAKSFRDSEAEAHLCFEFSSEGEYQQVASLIEDALKAQKKVELVFFSPSVEKSVLDLYNRYPTQIRYLRYPLVTYTPWRSFSTWATAKTLNLVRYDFLPEFLLWTGELNLLWVTFKKERTGGKSISWYKMLFYRKAQHIFFASEKDEEQGRSLGLKGQAYDFRITQIKRRLDKRHEKFSTQFAVYPELKRFMVNFPEDRKLIFGNAWPSDLFLLEKLDPSVFVLIVPHELTPKVLGAMEEILRGLGRELVIVENVPPKGWESTVILNTKGVLSELYQDFERAYVGGGFERSIHSILEPLVAGCRLLSCGPKNHRSTEYDVADTHTGVTVVESAEELLAWFSGPLSSPIKSLAPVFESYEERRKEIISC